MTGHDTHKPASSTRVGIALVLTVLATGAVAAQELPRSGQAALLPPRPDLILAAVEIPDGTSLNFRIRGTPVTLTNQAVACKCDPAPVTGHVKTVEILVDRTSIETFVNEGEVSLSACFLPADDRLDLVSDRGPARIRSLRVFEIKSLWSRD